MADIFISYASEDREKAKQLAEALEAQGWSVWWDRNIPAGRRFAKVIEDALSAAKCVVVMWSTKSIESDWVIEEAEAGKARDILVPVLVEPEIEPPWGFRRIQAEDLSGWDGTAESAPFQNLTSAVRHLVEPGQHRVQEEERRQPETTAKRTTEEEEEQHRAEAQLEDSAQAPRLKTEARAPSQGAPVEAVGGAPSEIPSTQPSEPRKVTRRGFLGFEPARATTGWAWLLVGVVVVVLVGGMWWYQGELKEMTTGGRDKTIIILDVHFKRGNVLERLTLANFSVIDNECTTKKTCNFKVSPQLLNQYYADSVIEVRYSCNGIERVKREKSGSVMV